MGRKLKIRTRIGSFVFVFLVSLQLFSAIPNDWSSAFSTAEAAFNSRSQNSSITLFQALIDQVEAVRGQRELTDDESGLLQKSYDFLGQAYFNRNQQEDAGKAFLKLIAINPQYKMNDDLVSAKIIALVAQLKQDNLGTMSVTGTPASSKVLLDGHLIGVSDLNSVPVIRGDHSVQIVKAGYVSLNVAVTAEPGADRPVTFELKPDPGAAKDLLAQGKNLLMQNNPKEAKASLEEALPLLQSASGSSDLFDCLLALGDAQQGLKDSAGAGARYAEAVSLAQKSGNASQEGIGDFRLASLQKEAGETAAAIQTAQSAVVVLRKSQDKKDLAAALRLLALLQQKTNDAGASRLNFEEALAIFKDLGDKAVTAATLLELGSLNSSTDKTTAKANLEEAAALFVELGDRENETRARTQITGLQGNKQADLIAMLQSARESLNARDFSTAETKYHDAIAAAESSGDKANEVTALISLGFIYSEQKNDPAAKEEYEKAVGLAREIGDKTNLALGLFNLATANFNLRNIAEANSQYEESAAISRANGDPVRPRPW